MTLSSRRFKGMDGASSGPSDRRNSAWLRVTSVLTPGHPLTMHSFADTFRPFSNQPGPTLLPSAATIPTAKYKAPLILVQSGSDRIWHCPGSAFTQSRSSPTMQPCDGSQRAGKDRAEVGFIRPAKHSIQYSRKTWTVPGRLAKQLRIATISIWQAMRRQTKPTRGGPVSLGKISAAWK